MLKRERNSVCSSAVQILNQIIWVKYTSIRYPWLFAQKSHLSLACRVVVDVILFYRKVSQPIRRLVVCGKANRIFVFVLSTVFVAELDRCLLNNRITAGLLNISTLVITFYEFHYKSRRWKTVSRTILEDIGIVLDTGKMTDFPICLAVLLLTCCLSPMVNI
jgi:hypothetical protein